jgi:acyl carrier protein
MGRCRFFNAYGPTETTITATCVECRDGLLPPLIGRPLPNVRVYLLDRALQPVPVGVAGELCIGGIGVARGYINRPELTAERFLVDPFQGGRGARMYRSGDFARWTEEGQIEFLGRQDDQVKIRGLRIELGEIEAVLRRHPAVREAVALVREDLPGEKQLAAYIVCSIRSAGLENELRGLLREVLPEYMVPSRWVQLEALPRTPNGKLDRKHLPVPTAEGPATLPAVVPSRTATEAMVLEVFRTELGRGDFGVLENFFDLGGHSLMAARLVSAVRAESGVDISLRELFARPTVAGLAEAVDALRWNKESGDTAGHAGRQEMIEL